MPRENIPRRVWNRQTKFPNNHWLVALVTGKCSSTKPTRIATGVVCHLDTEQNRPYKIPWPCRELNRGPTAPQARTFTSVPHYSTDSMESLTSSVPLVDFGVAPICTIGLNYFSLGSNGKWQSPGRSPSGRAPGSSWILAILNIPQGLSWPSFLVISTNFLHQIENLLFSFSS